MSFFREMAAGAENNRGAFVAIVAASGSAPRGLGAKMLVRPDGSIAGTIGGGAVEHAAIRLAVEWMGEGRSGLREYHLSTDEVSDLGMICGGRVTVCILQLNQGNAPIFSCMADCAGRNAHCTLVTAFRQEAVELYLDCENSPAPLPAGWRDLDLGRLHLEERDGVRFAVDPVVAGERVIVCGAGHVGRELVTLLRFLNFYTIVLDDRAEFLRPENLPDANERRHVDFSVGLEGLGITSRDDIVILTRGHLHDYALLRQALRTPARYIGMIGSRGKVGATFDKLTAEGVLQRDLDRVHAPIGLSIGGKTPAEVALSIAAQLVQEHHAAENNGTSSD